MLKFNWILSLFLFILCSCTTQTKADEKGKKLLFVGDLLLDRGVRDRIEYLGIESLFHPSIDSLFSVNDYVFANLECPATNIIEPIHKKYVFRANPEWLSTLKKHGITHLCMANNHSMDQGRNGLIDTKNNILRNKLIPLGFGENQNEACQAILICSSPRKVYLISSLQVPSENWTYLEDSPCICEENIEELNHRIRALKQKNPESIVLVQLHWGMEHTLVPMTSQKQEAYSLIDAGADCIIGHHPHTVQSIEYYKEKPIFYSIGNFIFDQSNPINKKGLMVQIEIKKKQVKFDTLPVLIQKCVPRLTN
jgi:poly-gamma-glutamate capsule biosynthesis protein CapA/YwtB (metallophosphatase superfamily)